MTEMKRRTLLGLGVAAAGGLVLGKSAQGAAGKKKAATGAGGAAAPAATAPGSAAAPAAGGGARTVVVWAEGTAPKNVYPNEINGAIAEGLKKSLTGWDVVVAGLADPDQGLPDSLLAKCDVLIWWGHKKHKDVKDELVARIVKRVKDEGMGFIALHSSHFAKPNKALMGTPCSWGAYKVDATTCTIKTKDPKHPICEGLPAEFTFKHEERYSEPYAVPEPKAVPLDGFHLLKDGSKDNARIGLCWEVGKAKYFYFMAGHETNPVFMDENVQKVMANAVKWAAPAK